MNARRCLAFSFAAAPAWPLGAQTFGPLVGGHLPFSGGGATPPEIEDLLGGDLDGDGAPDLVVLGSSFNVVCRNDRSGGLVSWQSLPPQYVRLRRGVLADVDGDGDLDLLAGEGSNQPNRSAVGPIRQYENRGGNFVDVTAQRMPAGSWLNGMLVAFDHDGDGDLDLAAAPLSNELLIFDNDGNGTFTPATAARLPAVLPRFGATFLAATDLDRDSDLDLLAAGDGSSPTTLLFLRNDGAGHFTDDTARLPGGNELVHAVVDIDRDGDDDLLRSATILVNNGTASSFTPRATGVALNQFDTVRVADLDGDNRPDFLSTQLYAKDTLPRVYLAQADGTFLERPGFMPPELRTAQAASAPSSYWVGAAPLAVSDLDRDGRPDVVHGGWKGHGINGSWTVGVPPKALFNRDGVEFRDGSRRTLPLVEHDCTGLFAADLDGNGSPDLILGQDVDRVYRNRGDGSFELGESLPGPGGTCAGALRDLDGDGDLDFVRTGADLFRPRTGALSLLLRQSGVWTPAPLPAISDQVAAIAAGDVDGDGDADLVLGCFNSSPLGAPARLLFNDGSARFADATAGRLPPDLAATAQALLRDVDGDGDLDLIELVRIFPADGLRLLLNDGSGTFTDVSSTRLPALSPTALAAVDADRDGDVDLVVPGTTLVNDGTGRFLPQANGFPQFDHLVEIAGSGSWTAVEGQLNRVAIGGVSHAWAFGSRHSTLPLDVDRDGDLDVVVGAALQVRPYDFGLVHGVLFNLQHQLDAPRLARIGQAWILSLQATSAGALGLALIGTAELAPRQPIGTCGLLGVDPHRAFVLPALAVGPSPAPRELSLPVPADPALVGVPLHAQALVVPGSGLQDARLTGVVSDRITR